MKTEELLVNLELSIMGFFYKEDNTATFASIARKFCFQGSSF
jgi:hypothetical protein